MHVNLRPERRSRLWRLLIPFALVATAIVAIGGPAQAAAPSLYSATITPNVAGEGTTNDHTFTITKVSGGGSIGSVNIVVPPEFTEDLLESSLGTITPMPAPLEKTGPQRSTAAPSSPRSPDQSATVAEERPEPQPDDLADGVCGMCTGLVRVQRDGKGVENLLRRRDHRGKQPDDHVLRPGVHRWRRVMRQTRTRGRTCRPPCPRRHARHQLPRSSERRLRDRGNRARTGAARPAELSGPLHVAFFVPGASPSTDVCKSSDGGVTYEELSSCSGSNSAPCIASESGGPGGRNYVLDLLPGDPNIDFS